MGKHMDSRKRFRILCLILFILYVIAIIYFLLLSDIYGRADGYSDYRYNLIPFLEISRFIRSALNGGSIQYVDIIINLIGNVAAFIPFGALIRWVRNQKTGFGIAVLYTFLFSLGIELIQLFTRVGVFDVDDLILNTCGGAIGYVCYRILRKIDRRRYRDVEKKS